MSEWWEYENLPSKAPYDWGAANRGNHPDDNVDFHLDLGCGKLPKGRLTIDRHGEADLLIDLNLLAPSDWDHAPTVDLYNKVKRTGVLPFPDNSIESIISHHLLEHLREGFIPLMDECYRVLKPGGIFRIIVPLFPSLSAVSDPEHVRYFTKDTFESFCGTDNYFWSDSFAEPYTKARFKLVDKNYTPAVKYDRLVNIDQLFEQPREIRVTLKK